MTNARRDFLRASACTLGGLALASTVESLGLVETYAQTAGDYRALVCVFLNGGNDGANMIVPLDADSFNQYTAIRGPSTLALAQASLVPVNPPSQGRQFGLHPSLAPEVANPSVQFKGLLDVWNQGRLAVVCNVGPLVEPLTRVTYQNGTGKRPLQLFSHSDQINLWQSAVANSVSRTGWGGRLADRSAALNGSSTFPQVVTIAGISLFVTGATALPLALGDSRSTLGAALPLTMTANSSGSSATDVPTRRAAFDALRAFDAEKVLVRADADVRSSALRTKAQLDTAPNTDFAKIPATALGFQLEQVARLIALRDTLGVKRQIFFCQLGGFDTHSNQRVGNGQDALLLQVAQALRGFWDTLGDLGMQDNVTTFTLSDFGRTFQPAGSGSIVGTDHGWGNHHFVMGGAVRGGNFYGTYPTLALGGPDDADTRGRWIPTTSVEQYAATLASWYGLSASDFPAVFPLLDRFPTPNMGFML
ncbi:MAG TPA: DUF1501 domain-containing protein [Pyrinomonadaceae bacterium]|nr:DUF1501 domain-containing protein [Pyrinomonadaceae bacterium]